MKFVEKLEFVSNLDSVKQEFTELVNSVGWIGNQIGLRHRSNASNIWADAIGSLYDRVNNVELAVEKDFDQWGLVHNSYIRSEIERLSLTYKFDIGRARFMQLLSKQGLTVHHDNEVRYHLVLETNPKSYICHNFNEPNNNLVPISTCYHIPRDGHWYRVNTTEVHWVYNGGLKNRIHLVVCPTV